MNFNVYPRIAFKIAPTASPIALPVNHRKFSTFLCHYSHSKPGVNSMSSTILKHILYDIYRGNASFRCIPLASSQYDLDFMGCHHLDEHFPTLLFQFALCYCNHLKPELHSTSSTKMEHKPSILKTYNLDDIYSGNAVATELLQTHCAVPIEKLFVYVYVQNAKHDFKHQISAFTHLPVRKSEF